MDIYSSTKPLWIISRICGLHASAIPKDATLQIKKDKGSIQFAPILWNIYTALLLITGLYFEYVFECTGSSLNVSKIVQITDQLITVFNTSTFCIAIAYSFIHRHTLKMILLEFIRIEEDMARNLCVQMSHKSTCSVVNYGLAVIIIIAILSVAVLFALPFSNRLYVVKGWILYYIFIDIADIHVIQFITLVFILRQHLRKLEHELSTLQNENINQRYTTRKIKDIQETKFRKIDEVKTMLCVKTCSRNLYEISLNINNMFSVPLFFSIANSFISLFSGMYFSSFGFIYGAQIFKPTNVMDSLPTVVLLLRHVVKFLCITVLCENTYTIRKNIGWVLHSIQTDGKKQSFKQNVTEYSMQLIHEKIIFTASGFFDVNSNVLQMIISSVTIYLVILIQFDKAANQD